MTRIVTSSYTEGTAQADGRRYVTERHVDDLGRPLSFEYLASDDMDRGAILSARAARLNADYDAREAEAAEAARGRIPWSKLEFRDQLGPVAERVLDKMIVGVETMPLPDEATRDMLRTGFARYREAHYIERPLRAEVVAMLGLLQSLGALSSERVAAIVAAAEG